MKEGEKSYRTKQKMLVLVPIIILLFVCVKFVSNLSWSMPTKTIELDGEISKSIEKAIKRHQPLRIVGAASDFTYEWYYDLGTITSSESTDLSLRELSPLKEKIEDVLSADQIIVFKYSDSCQLNGTPELTVHINKIGIHSLKTYVVIEDELHSVTYPIINISEDGADISYKVKKTSDIMCIAVNCDTCDELIAIESTDYKKLTPTLTLSPESVDVATIPKKTESKEENEKKHEEVKEPTPESTVEPTLEPILEPTVVPTKDLELDEKITPSPTKAVEKTQKPIVTNTLTPTPEFKEKDESIVEDIECQCTLNISCKTLLDHMDEVESEKRNLIPPDGVIVNSKKVAVSEGETVFDVLVKVLKKEGIPMEYSGVPGDGSIYIEGINNLYEFDGGSLSGWMYQVNGAFPNYSCSKYLVQENDIINWEYTCDLGRDVGCEWIDSN